MITLSWLPQPNSTPSKNHAIFLSFLCSWWTQFLLILVPQYIPPPQNCLNYFYNQRCGGGGGRRQALIINLNFCYFLTKGKQHRWVYYKRSSKHFQQRQFGIFTSHNKVPRIKSQLHSVSASWGCVPWEMVGNVLVSQSLLSPGKACMNSLACWDFSCWRHLENR